MRRCIVALFLLSAIARAADAQSVTLVAGPEKVTAPFGALRDTAGNLVIVEYSGKLKSIAPDGAVTLLCGDGTKGDAGDGGPAKDARLNAPHAIARGADDALYIADTLNHKVRRIDARTGVINTVAGSAKGFAGDGGPADEARFNGIYCIAFNPNKDKLIITDLENRRIRVMDMTTRRVTTTAGNGQKGVPADGATAVEAPLVDPRAAAMDAKGNLYILERSGHAMRVVDAQGKIRTLVPGPFKPKDPSAIRGPKHLLIDKDDNVILTDTDHHAIVRWPAAGKELVPVAGTGKRGNTGVPGAPAQVELNEPHGVFLEADGSLIICDTHNNRVLRLR